MSVIVPERIDERQALIDAYDAKMISIFTEAHRKKRISREMKRKSEYYEYENWLYENYDELEYIYENCVDQHTPISLERFIWMVYNTIDENPHADPGFSIDR